MIIIELWLGRSTLCELRSENLHIDVFFTSEKASALR